MLLPVREEMKIHQTLLSVQQTKGMLERETEQTTAVATERGENISSIILCIHVVRMRVSVLGKFPKVHVCRARRAICGFLLSDFKSASMHALAVFTIECGWAELLKLNRGRRTEVCREAKALPIQDVLSE